MPCAMTGFTMPWFSELTAKPLQVNRLEEHRPALLAGAAL